MVTKEQERILGLDVVRAIAILMVLCSHVLWIYPEKNPLIESIFQLFGFLGVELFFVLSGFLIGSILFKLYVQEEFGWSTVFFFLKRRWYRTLPNYFLILILNVIIAAFVGITMPNVFEYFFFLQNFKKTMPAFFPESWSLSVEEFAYLFTPLTLLLFSFFRKPKSKSKRFLVIIIGMILLFFVNRIIYNFNTSNTTLPQWNLSLKAVVIYRIDSILIGIVAAWLCSNCKEFWKNKKIMMAVFGFFLLVFQFVGVGFLRITIDKFPFFWNVLYFPLSSLALVLFLPFFQQWNKSSSWIVIPFTFVSKVSYSVYLIHYSVVLLLMKYCIDTQKLATFELNVFTMIYLILTFGLSYFLYRFFEKPIMNLRDKS